MDLSLHDLGNDRLLVVAYLDDGSTLEAHGWISATLNHYDAELDEFGHRPDDTKPRKMTQDEVLAYAERLIREQHADHFPAEFSIEDYA